MRLRPGLDQGPGYLGGVGNRPGFPGAASPAVPGPVPTADDDWLAPPCVAPDDDFESHPDVPASASAQIPTNKATLISDFLAKNRTGKCQRREGEPRPANRPGTSPLRARYGMVNTSPPDRVEGAGRVGLAASGPKGAPTSANRNMPRLGWNLKKCDPSQKSVGLPVTMPPFLAGTASQGGLPPIALVLSAK